MLSALIAGVASLRYRDRTLSAGYLHPLAHYDFRVGEYQIFPGVLLLAELPLSESVSLFELVGKLPPVCAAFRWSMYVAFTSYIFRSLDQEAVESPRIPL